MSDVLEKNKSLFDSVREILITARKNAYRAVKSVMVHAYWQIGRLIVEDEQQGNQRAEYGKNVLNDLSKRLTSEFGKGFTTTNLIKNLVIYHK